MTDTTPRRGRPALAPSERRGQQLHVPVSPPEMAALVAWSEQEQRPIAALVRETALRAARRHR